MKYLLKTLVVAVLFLFCTFGNSNATDNLLNYNNQKLNQTIEFEETNLEFAPLACTMKAKGKINGVKYKIKGSCEEVIAALKEIEAL